MSTKAILDSFFATATTSDNLALNPRFVFVNSIFPAFTVVASGVKGLFSSSHFFLPPSSNFTFCIP